MAKQQTEKQSGEDQTESLKETLSENQGNLNKIVNFSWLLMNIDGMIYSGNCIKRSPGMY